MLARVKQDYAAGPVMAFSGHEYVRGEWREVPAGFEEQAANHLLLETQASLDEVRADSAMLPGLGTLMPEEKEATVMVETTEPQATELEGETKSPRKHRRSGPKE